MLRNTNVHRGMWSHKQARGGMQRIVEVPTGTYRNLHGMRGKAHRGIWRDAEACGRRWRHVEAGRGTWRNVEA